MVDLVVLVVVLPLVGFTVLSLVWRSGWFVFGGFWVCVFELFWFAVTSGLCGWYFVGFDVHGSLGCVLRLLFFLVVV